MFLACSSALAALSLLASPAFADAACPSGAASSSAVGEGAASCSTRSLFLPPLDGSGSPLLGGSGWEDNQVLSMSGAAGYMAGSDQFATHIAYSYQLRNLFTLGLGLPLAVTPAQGGGARPSTALAADLKFKVREPTGLQFGGLSLQGLLRGQTPGLPSVSGERDDGSVELRALGGYRLFIVNAQLTAGIRLEPGRADGAWSFPLGAALNVFLAPPSWSEDARPAVFVEWLSYAREGGWSEALLAGLAYHFHDGSLGLGLGWSLLGGQDSFFLRLSWTARTVLGDRDGDGVPDDADQCRDLPEDKDGVSDEDGCPDLNHPPSGAREIGDVCGAGARAVIEGASKTTDPLKIGPIGLDGQSATRLVAKLAPAICETGTTVYLSSEVTGAAEAAQKAILAFTGRADGASPVVGSVFDDLDKRAVRERWLRLSLDVAGAQGQGKLRAAVLRKPLEAPAPARPGAKE